MMKDKTFIQDDYENDFVEQQDDFSRIQSQEDKQKSFNLLYIPDKSGLQKQQKQPTYKTQIPQSIQTMFIIFSYFKGDLEELGKEYSCKLKIILNKIKITSINATQLEFEQCKKKIIQKIERIVYIKMTTIKDRVKIYNSPFFTNIAKKEKFAFTKFDKQIYAFSNKLTQNQLKIKVKNVCFGHIIFQTPFKPLRCKDVAIYEHIRQFIRKIIDDNKITFEERSVRVQLSNSLDTVQMIGQRQADCMFARNLMKNTFQSMVIIVIRDQDIARAQGQKKIKALSKYVLKVSKYPIHIGPVGNNILTVISKDNILAKLFTKEKFLKELNLTPKKQFGLFLPFKFSFSAKIAVIEEICNKNGYDFNSNMIYYFFKRVFVPESQQDQINRTLKIFGQVMQAWKDVKQKYQIIYKRRFQQNNSIRQEFSGQYYLTGQNQEDNEASNILKRDIMKDLIKMSKKNLVNYNVFQGVEKNIYWYQNQHGKTICDVQKICFDKKKRYFKGKIKTSGNQSIYFYEAEIKAI